jgi:rare lipoprotein A
MKRIIALIVTGLTLAGFCAAQTESSRYGIFRQEGIASWYGEEFAGRPTASGELFNPGQFTAAHPTLAFGTILKVTNKHNNRSVTVRVNDRGPFVSARIIDVSLAAAEQLDMITTGTAPVFVESVTQIALPPTASETVPWRNTADMEPLPSTPEIAVYDDELGGPVLKPLDAPPPQARTTARPVPTPEVYPARVPSPVVNSNPVTAQVTPPVPASPVYRPTETVAPVQTAAPTPPPTAAPAQTALPAAPVAPIFRPVPRGEPVPLPPAVILPDVPPAGDGKLYRIQVGSYKVPRNAADAFEKLRQAGLSPAYERNGDFYRIVLSKVRSDDVETIAGKLGTAGFREALIRAEN